MAADLSDCHPVQLEQLQTMIALVRDDQQAGIDGFAGRIGGIQTDDRDVGRRVELTETRAESSEREERPAVPIEHVDGVRLRVADVDAPAGTVGLGNKRGPTRAVRVARLQHRRHVEIDDGGARRQTQRQSRH